MLDPHFIIAEGFKLTKTRKMKTQTKPKEERFERVVKWKGWIEDPDFPHISFWTGLALLIVSIIALIDYYFAKSSELFPLVFIIMGIFFIILDITIEYFLNRVVYWRKIK